MHIESTRLLEDNALNVEFDVDRRLDLQSTSLDWNDSSKIEKAITIDKDNKN